MQTSRPTSGSEGVSEGPVLLMAAATWAAMWVATLGAWWLVGGCSLIALAAGVHFARRRAWLAASLALLSLGCLVAGGARAAALSLDPIRSLAVAGATVEVTAEIRDSSVRPAHGVMPVEWRGTARLVEVSHGGNRWTTGTDVELVASGDLVVVWTKVPVGARVRVFAKLASPNEGEPLVALARVRGAPTIDAPPPPLIAGVEAVRAGLRTASDELSADQRALVPAVVVGDTDLLDSTLTQRFKTTSLQHITAVSGANLTLLLVFVSFAAVSLGVTGWWLRGLLVVMVVVFVALCRAEPSVIRAAAMGVVGLVALGWGRHGRAGIRYLAVAVIVLLGVDPWLSQSLGFSLSVAASYGLIRWSSSWAALLARWLPGALAEGVAIPLAAQVATQPLLVMISGQVSLVGVVANAVAAPLVGPATVLGFAAAGLSVVWLPLARVFAAGSGLCVQGLVWVAGLGDAFPGAAVTVGNGPVSVVLTLALCLGAVRFMPELLRRPWVVAALVGALAIYLVQPWSGPGWPPGDWRVVVCDVGQGDGTVVRAGPGVAVVIDTGPDPKLMDRCLTRLGVRRVALLVLTHGHADHVGGIAGVATGGRMVDEVLMPVTPRVKAGLLAAAAPSLSARTADAYDVGEAHLQIVAAGTVIGADTLGVDDEGSGDSAVENDASTVGVITSGGVSLLFGGDVETEAQDAIADRAHAATVLLVPHHGSSRQAEAFLAATRAGIALISVGAKNDYGHPTSKTLQLLQKLGLAVVRTDQHGALAVIAASDGGLHVVTER